MLTDTQLKNLKPTGKLYKLVDRDGLYVAVTPSGVVSFRYDYRLNGRRETLVLGQYGPEGLTLGEAREKLIGAKKEIAAGKSPAKEKQRSIQKSKAAKTFGEFSTLWLKEYRMADSTRDMRKSVIDRDIEPEFGRRLLKEIAAEDLRALCERVKTQRNAPATAVHIRDIVAQVFRFAIERGHKVANPADDVRASSIATFKPKDRALSPDEIRIFFQELDLVPTLPTIRLALKLVLLTLIRKGELLNATWDEMDFVGAKWIIPAQRMKARRPHVIYLPDQAMDIMIALKTCAGGSNFILPSRYEGDKGMSNNTLNRVITVTVEHAKKKDLPLDDFTVHDLRRTGSTLLHEAGFTHQSLNKSTNMELAAHMTVSLCMKRDGRTFDRKTLEEIRLMAVERVREGEPAAKVIEAYGFNRTTIYKWLKAALQPGLGIRALRSTKAPGRARTLTPRQEGQVVRWVNGRDPRQYGLDFGLWTRAVVAELIESKFGIKLGVTAIGELLARLGLTPQKPLQRAYQRDPVAIERWQHETFPAIAKQAKAEGAEIFFWDESGFRADTVHGKTWGVRGQTPVVQRPGQRQSISAASAVNANGAFWFCTYEGGLNAELFVELLAKMMRYRRKPIHLVLDSLPAHKTTLVKEFVATTEGRLTLHFLPGYAPDLNPDELVWSHVKRTGTARRPLRKGEKLRDKIEEQLAKLQKLPHLVRSFFQTPSVAYIGDC